ncbi:hypothetical protein CCR95_09995 [Thiocystis minor]|nr:hypothetical protein [Thiocystis minor]
MQTDGRPQVTRSPMTPNSKADARPTIRPTARARPSARQSIHLSVKPKLHQGRRSRSRVMRGTTMAAAKNEDATPRVWPAALPWRTVSPKRVKRIAINDPRISQLERIRISPIAWRIKLDAPLSDQSR